MPVCRIHEAGGEAERAARGKRRAEVELIEYGYELGIELRDALYIRSQWNAINRSQSLGECKCSSTPTGGQAAALLIAAFDSDSLRAAQAVSRDHVLIFIDCWPRCSHHAR